VGADQGVVGVVVGRREQAAVGAELQRVLGVLRQQLAEVDRHAGLACLAQPMPGAVGDDHRHLQLVQGLARPLLQAVAPAMISPPGAGAEVEPARQPAEAEAVQQHGGQDQHEHQRQQQLGAGEAALASSRAEHAGHGGGHHAARRDPAHQGALLPAHAGADGGQPDRRRAHQQDDGEDQQRRCASPARQDVRVQVRGQQQEHAGDQQHRDVLLEAADSPMLGRFMLPSTTPITVAAMSPASSSTRLDRA
jgi:hypothetical protein